MIAFRILGGRFSLYWGRLALTALMVAVLCFLGAWQIRRLEEKTQLLQLVETRTHASWTDLSVLLIGDDIDYMPVSASGQFNHEDEMYITAINQQGEGGYDVLTPMLLEDGRWVLVNRGWIPYSRRGPSTRQEGQLAGMVRIHGIIRLPHRNFWMHGRDAASGIWRGIDLVEMARQNGIPSFLPFVVEVDATPNPGGLPVGGQTHFDLPNNHLLYAMTWYGLGFVAIFIFLISSWQKLPEDEVDATVSVPSNPRTPSPIKDDLPRRRQS